VRCSGYETIVDAISDQKVIAGPGWCRMSKSDVEPLNDQHRASVLRKEDAGLLTGRVSSF